MDCTALKLYRALIDAGYTPRGYSGRGMFAKLCVAVAVDTPNDAPWNLARQLSGKIVIPAPHKDQLGLGYILYWPQFEWRPSFDADDESVCPDCGDPTENGLQCGGCRANEAVRR